MNIRLARLRLLGTFAIVTLMVIVVAVAIVLAQLPEDTPVATAPAEGTRSIGLLVDTDQLRTKALLARGSVEPWASQVSALVQAADRALACVATGGGPGPRDFEVAVRALEASSSCVYTLALAALASDQPRYERRAAELALAWMDADPCVLWGRGCEAAAPTAVVTALPADVARLDATAIEFAVGIDLLRTGGGLGAADEARLIEWISKLLPGGSPPLGVDGDLQVALRLAIGSLSDDDAVRDAAMGEWRQRLALIRPDGRVGAGEGAILDLDETQRALGYRLLAVAFAGPAGPEMIEASVPGDLSIRSAVDALAGGMAAPTDWSEVTAPDPGPVWELAYRAWGAAAHRPLVAALRGPAEEGTPPLRWPSLAFGVADPRIATAVPSPSASAAPTPTPFSTPVPGVGVPLVDFRLGSVVNGAIPASVAWQPATALPGGATRYRVNLRQNSGTWNDLGTTDKTNLGVRLPVGPTLQLRVRASAESGASTSWVNGPPFVIRWFEESTATVSPPTAWGSASNTGYSRGTLAWAEKRGATITFVVEGSAIALRAPVGPTRGQARVRIDGGPATVIDEYADRFSPAVIVFFVRWDEPGRHEISIEVLGTSGRATVSIDALAVLP